MSAVSMKFPPASTKRSKRLCDVASSLWPGRDPWAGRGGRIEWGCNGRDTRVDITALDHTHNSLLPICWRFAESVFIPYLSLTKRHRAQAQSGHFQPTAAEIAVGQLHIVTGHLESNPKVKGHEPLYRDTALIICASFVASAVWCLGLLI